MALRAERESLRGRPRSESTMRSYACDWKSFAGWCAGAGHASLPASADTLALYITWLLTKDKKRISTAQRHLAAITDSHRRSSLLPPATADAREVIAFVKRVRREQPRRKAPLAVADLVSVARSYDTKTLRGLRDRAVIVLGFATTLRRSDLAELRLSDVKFDERGLTVWLRHSKNDQEGKGRSIGVWPGKRASTDPVRVLKAWIDARGHWAGPLFCRIQSHDTLTREPITGEVIARIVKSAADELGLDSSQYAGHSLRAGAITASANIGRSDQEMMKLSGHSSARMLKIYNRGTEAFRGRNPLAGVL